MYLEIFLADFTVFHVYWRISRDFAEIPEFRGSATARNMRSPDNVMLQWTLALWIPRFTGTLIIRTAAESPVKITDILTETNSRYYTDLLTPLLVPTQISISTFRHFGRIISDYNIFLPLPLFVSVTLVEFKWTFWFPFITWCFYETMVFTCKKKSWCT